MPKNIVVKDTTTGNKTEMEVEDNHRIGDIVDEAVNFFKRERAMYWLKRGKNQLSPDRSIGDAEIRERNFAEIIPDPTKGVFKW